LARRRDRFNWALDWFDPDQATADADLRPAHRNVAPYQRIRRIEFMELPKASPARFGESTCGRPKTLVSQTI
jgi:hypothetical protein